MSKMLFSTILFSIFFFTQSIFAITIINQTNSKKEIKIVEAYRPASKKSGDLATPKSLGYSSKKMTIEPHSMKKISLKGEPTILVVSVFSKKLKGLLLEYKYCFEPYEFNKQKENHFNDEWGFVIHKPIGIPSPCHELIKLKLKIISEQGYGIKCLHPLLLPEVTSLKKLPKNLELHFAGETPMNSKVIK